MMPVPLISNPNHVVANKPTGGRVLLCVCWLWLTASTPLALADALDVAANDDPLLGLVVSALAARDVGVASNLNARDVIGARLERPRLGRFPDIPQDLLPGSEEIGNWEREYQEGAIGGLAILGESSAAASGSALTISRWLDAASDARMFVTFHIDDQQAIESIQGVVDAHAFSSLLLTDPQRVAVAGELYATAAQRLALDSRTARRYKSEVVELQYLGKRVRRDVNSLFKSAAGSGNVKVARNEPAVFLKETLGDEFNQSTIREIVVPGGVALGESAELTITPARLQYAQGELTVFDEAGTSWSLPSLPPATLKALFDFVSRSQMLQSDAIVDIEADGRVRIAAPLRDTDAGYAIMEADTQPFSYVRNLPVTKSVIIDTAVDWFAMDDKLQFETEFEVRFLSADNMRIAQTRVALQYQFSSRSGAIDYADSWGRDARRLQDSLDYTGLGESVVVVAKYAGWIALLRTLDEANVPFLHGRYEFMKLDKSGRRTPAKY